MKFFLNKFFMRLFFLLYFSLFFSILILYLFLPVFNAKNIFFSLLNKNIDIVSDYPSYWNFMKNFFCLTTFFSLLITLNSIFSIFLSFFSTNIKDSVEISRLNHFSKSNEISIFIGNNKKGNKINIPLIGLYQNILVTGSIGSGKTSSLLYPLTYQLLNLNFSNLYNSAFLILDVKGNYYKFVKKICQANYSTSDLFIISLDGLITYNPLDKPDLKPQILANRLKNILLLFSPHQSESFWLDKAEQILTEAIKFCRLYNENYVTFIELHKVIMYKSYYEEKLTYLNNLFFSDKLTNLEIETLNSCSSFFNNEFFSLDERTSSILKAEISRITNIFVSDCDVSKIFCPDKKNISFPGFRYILKNHKIVVLDMNISEYSYLSKIIAAYLKIDFQSEILIQLSSGNIYPSCFICDEYHEYVTSNDASFFAQSREAKSINIVATQSYSSLLNSIKDPTSTKVLIQNLVNKFWFRTDDSFTIDEILKQTGKEEKKVQSTTIAENARKTNFNFWFNSFSSKDSNLSESINTSIQKDYIFDSNFFSRNLETFSCLSFISTGSNILPIEKLTLLPYFKRKDVIL